MTADTGATSVADPTPSSYRRSYSRSPSRSRSRSRSPAYRRPSSRSRSPRNRSRSRSRGRYVGGREGGSSSNARPYRRHSRSRSRSRSPRYDRSDRYDRYDRRDRYPRRDDYNERSRRPVRSVHRGTEEERSRSTTLYLGNLPFSYTERDVSALMERFGRVRKITVPIDSIRRHNRGFSFVEFEARPDAEAALTKYQGHVLEGRALRVDWDVGSERKQTSVRGDEDRRRDDNDREVERNSAVY
jgi:hypothetical protein